MIDTTAFHRDDLTIDQQVALRTAAARLGAEFDGVYGTETIERFLHTSYDQFAAHSTVPHFLPLLAERFARQRLTALARVEGLHHDGRRVVLFLCVHNAGRSQMALGFFNHLAGERAVAWSGGSDPGIDITGVYPKPWTDEIVRAADVVITMGCGDACPIFPGKRYEDWTFDDPAGLSVEDIRPIRDAIERRVRRLLDELGVSTGADRPAPAGSARRDAAGRRLDRSQ
jgi:arsenate reductase (thioredoxin)